MVLGRVSWSPKYSAHDGVFQSEAGVLTAWLGSLLGGARLILPLDRGRSFMANSVELPRPLEVGDRLCRGGSPTALVIVLRPLEVTMPRAVPVAVTDGTDFLDLVSRLLPLRLRFFIRSVLRDRSSDAAEFPPRLKN